MYSISYMHVYTYPSYKKYIYNNFAKPHDNNDLNNKPKLYSQFHTFDITDEPSQEPTEKIEPIFFSTLTPSKYVIPVKNFTCICEYNNDKNKNLIIISCVSSTLCLILFVTLIWYRFIFKKKLLKWQYNEANFGFGSVEI